MTRKAKYFKEVQDLIEMGMDAKQIIALRGIPKTTVYRIRQKLIQEAKYDFLSLLNGEYIWTYIQTLANFTKTIRQCNERIDGLPAKYAQLEREMRAELEATPPKMAMVRATLLQAIANLQSAQSAELKELVAQRDKASNEKARTLNQGAFAKAVDELIRTGQKIEPNVPEILALVAEVTGIPLAPSEAPKNDTLPEALPVDVNIDMPPTAPQPIIMPTADDLEVLKKMDEDSESKH